MKGWIEWIRQYIKDTQAETRRVIWPNRKYVASASIVILFIVLLMGGLVMLIDLGFSTLLSALMKSGRGAL